TGQKNRNPDPLRATDVPHRRHRGHRLRSRDYSLARWCDTDEVPIRNQKSPRDRAANMEPAAAEFVLLAAPQGFEPRYADPESAVLPLNEGAVAERPQRNASPHQAPP